MMKTEDLIYTMMTTNTGAHMCDSGGQGGRHWERNGTKTLEDFRNEAEAVLNISKYQDGFEAYPRISLFHHLVKTLSQDELCREFNDLPCDDWNGSYYGVSSEGDAWLTDHGFCEINSFNSYNYDSALSQVIQGTWGEFDGEPYVLLQVHQGCDVRGGYTDAKLFKIDDDFSFSSERCSFMLGEKESLDFYGIDMTNYEGNYVDGEELNRLCALKGEGEVIGSIF